MRSGRLREIKNKVNNTEEPMLHIPCSDIKWLIEQEERAKLMEEYKRRFQDDLLEAVTENTTLIHENKRYREVLESIRSVKYHDGFNPYAYMMLEIIEWAEKGLERD